MRSLELFSGTGGLAKGLEIAGFDHAAFVEFNKYACESLAKNFDPSKVYCGDIRNFEFESVGKVDVVAGGPPCQPFSLGGKHKAFDDSRDMFPSAIKAIERLGPKAFVFENVKGLLRESFAEYFDYVIHRLMLPSALPKLRGDWRRHLEGLRKINFEKCDNLKYRVNFSLLNAADYGVPQCRERVVIVGIRSDVAETWSFPKQTHSRDRLLWDKFVTGEYWERHKLSKKEREPLTAAAELRVRKLRDSYGLFEPSEKAWVTVRDALSGVPHPSAKHSIADHIFRDGAKPYAGHSGSDIDHPAKTIKAGGHGVPGGENMIRYRDGSARYLTVFEAKRIQSFPDDFNVVGPWGEALRQLGNAVPVLLAQQIGKKLFATLKSASSGTSKFKELVAA
jgi:DNA (cytosine-5)-methyltransferase 1